MVPHRVLLLDRLQQAMGSRDASRAAVLFIDLDQFKLANDGYGHTAGDHVLQQLARRLLAVVRFSDTVARLAGDEFVILCERLPFVTEAYRLTQRVLATVTEPFSGRWRPSLASARASGSRLPSLVLQRPPSRRDPPPGPTLTARTQRYRGSRWESARWTAAATRAANNGCARVGRDRNSGCAWVPTKNG